MSQMAARDQWAEWLAERRFGGDPEIEHRFSEELAQRADKVLNYADLAEGETLLDVGCGEGLIGFRALERGAGTVIFSDISHDLLEFCTNPKYHEPKWPDDYWPGSPEPPSKTAWDECLATIRADAKSFADFAVKNVATLTEKIPHGTGQTYLRTVLVAVDHASYHVGQIVAVRRLLGAWPS